MSQSDDLITLFQKLENTVTSELKYHRTLEEVGGMLDTLLAASRTIEPETGDVLPDVPVMQNNLESQQQMEVDGRWPCGRET